MTDDMLAFGRGVLESQPFSVLLGTELTAFEKGMAELALDLKPEHRQQHGYAHGGIISYLADNALTFAGGSVMGDCLTLEYKINYLRPAVGERLVARARTAGVGRSQAVCTCDIYALKRGVEKLCATAQGTIWKLSKGD
ncbi:PaaI family thioesterase [Kordiimonas pumila]|uniref:PaaI family thioesterase n=1 Tax=Kordiimonas pumila TaxID=2161677 RepID=A0ABV7D3S4_9PROT|nr:PaaI family thioesterase [Kordiimonas pumila]